MPAIRALLFDKDGTLFDFQATWSSWARKFLTDLSRGDAAQLQRLSDAIQFDFARGVFSKDSLVIAGTPDEIAQALLPHLPGASPASLVNQMNVSASAAPQAEVVPLRPLLEGFRARGLKLGVATNDAEAPARAHLLSAGILDLFDFVSGYDSGFGSKPHPGPCFAFAEALNIRPAHIAMVGDSRHDLLAGRAAGCSTVAVATGYASLESLAPLATVTLDNVGALPRWLDELDAIAPTAA